jgi:MFS family permease
LAIRSGVTTQRWSGAPGLALLICLQMLPATMISPAIRPLFAETHKGAEGAMQAFMALSMLGGILATPLLARVRPLMRHPTRFAGVLCLIDGLLLAAMSLPIATSTVLGLRLLDGAAHVSASTVLMSEAARFGRSIGNGRAMGLAGGGIMLAIAFGSALGGGLLTLGPRAPFAASALLSFAVAALLALRPSAPELEPEAASEAGIGMRQLAVPISAAFVERFTVGCLVVTFALFAHRGFGLSDAAVGLHFAAFTIPFALLMYPVGRLSDSVPRSSILGLGGVAYSLSLLGLGYASAQWLWLPMFAGGCASALMFSPTLSYAASIAGPAGRTRAMSWVNSAGCLGMLLGPVAAGVTSAAFSGSPDPLSRYRAVFVLAAAAVLIWTLVVRTWLSRSYRVEMAHLAAHLEAEPRGLAVPALRAAPLR